MALTYPKSDLSPAMNNAISKWANSGIRDILIGSKNFSILLPFPLFSLPLTVCIITMQIRFAILKIVYIIRIKSLF
jgi:hypothetical protein